jgi:hypothetical protein
LAVPSIHVHLCLRLRPGDDDDLLSFFSQIPPRQRPAALKAALRAGGMSAGMVLVAVDDEDADFATGFLA